MANDETITFEVDGTPTNGYLARPEGGGNGAGVVVIHEWWGLNEHTKDIARRWAAEGFTALAPDLYEGVVTKDPQEASRLMHALAPDRALAVLDASVERLAATEGVDADRIGTSGYCMGGSFTLLLACRNRHIKAAAPFYGDIPSDEDLAQLTAPILFIGASKDGWITVEKMEGLRDALARLGKQGEVKIYEGADHAFFNDTRPEVYDAEAAADAWRRVTTFMREHLTRS
jgi:carboxymethylenebutenolidase